VDALTRTNATLGSALYMAPEQMQRMKQLDLRVDIYALGVTLFELLTVTQPFWAETLPQLCAEILTGTPRPLRSFRPDLPDAFAWVLERGYARDRDQRYPSVAELARALGPFAPPHSAIAMQRIARIGGGSGVGPTVIGSVATPISPTFAATAPSATGPSPT